jgi:hypothetical protein
VTNQIKDVVLRICAVFILGSLSTIGAASIFGINVVVASFIAGTLSVAKVAEELAHAFLVDGKLDKEEIDKAFADAEKSKK